MNKSVSIVDVAKHAGVSVSTVSLVMNNRPNVSAETAAAVWQSVRALGYRPGSAGGKKRGPKPGPRKVSRYPQVLLLQVGLPHAYFLGALHAALLHGIQEALTARGTPLLLAYAKDAQEAGDLLRRTKCEGVLLSGCSEAGRLCDALRRLPCVQVLGAPPRHEGWDYVSFSGMSAGRMAAEWVLDQDIAEAASISVNHFQCRELSLAFKATLEASGGTVADLHVDGGIEFGAVLPELNLGRLGSVFGKLASRGAWPRAVFLQHELLVPAFHRFCADRGERPGEDVAIVCAALPCPSLQLVRPYPVLVNLHPEEAGRQAVDQLLWRIGHRNEPRMTRLVEPFLQTPEGLHAGPHGSRRGDASVP